SEVSLVLACAYFCLPAQILNGPIAETGESAAQHAENGRIGRKSRTCYPLAPFLVRAIARQHFGGVLSGCSVITGPRRLFNDPRPKMLRTWFEADNVRVDRKRVLVHQPLDEGLGKRCVTPPSVVRIGLRENAGVIERRSISCVAACDHARELV